MSALDNVLEFVKVISSEVLGPNAAVLFNVAGIGGIDADGENVDFDDDNGEVATQQTGYQALGIVSRPLPPNAEGFHCEGIAARTNDGLEPVAYRDLRINRALNPTGEGNAPAPGQQMLAGYGGAFVSVKHDATTGLDTLTLYVPYAFDGSGVPQKAHAIIVDPTSGNSSIQFVHGDGVFLNLIEDAGGGPGLVAAVGASTFLKLRAGELTLQAERVLLKGNVYLGRSAEAGLPLLAGAASPAGPSVFISPV